MAIFIVYICMWNLHVHFNESLNTTKRLTVIASKIVKRVVHHIIITLRARNVCLQRERKHVDVSATSLNAPSMNSVIQTVHSFLMRRLISSISEILVRAGGGYFARVM